jgi:hypothetical protein
VLSKVKLYALLTALAIGPVASIQPVAAQTLHRTRDFQFAVPSGWKLVTLPPLGKPPRELRRWEIVSPQVKQTVRIDIEVDRSENPGKFPVRDAKIRASHLAQKLGYQQYRQQELSLKGVPGFYETWLAEVPPQPKFRVFAAHSFHKGAHVRVAAIANPASAESIAEKALHQVLSGWKWSPK